jgi:hypothetical protein
MGIAGLMLAADGVSAATNPDKDVKTMAAETLAGVAALGAASGITSGLSHADGPSMQSVPGGGPSHGTGIELS